MVNIENAKTILRKVQLSFKRIIFLTILLVSATTLKSQYGPLFWELRNYDSLPNYRKALAAFQQQDTATAFHILDSVSKICFNSGKYRKHYQAVNELAAMNFITGNFNKANQLFEQNLSKMISNSDSLHYEYAINLRFLNYLAHYGINKTADRLHFMQRQYAVLKAINDSSAIMVDCIGDLGFSHLTNGDFNQAINYLYQAREASLQAGLKEQLIRAEHTLINQLADNEPDLAYETFEQQYLNADRAYYKDSVVLVTLSYTLAEKSHSLQEYQKALTYIKEAETIEDAINLQNPKLEVAIPLSAAGIYSKLNQRNNFQKYATIAQEQYLKQADKNTIPALNLYLEIAEGFLPFDADSSLKYCEKANLLYQDDMVSTARIKLTAMEAQVTKKAYKPALNLAPELNRFDSVMDDTDRLKFKLLSLTAQSELFKEFRSAEISKSLNESLKSAEQIIRRLAVQMTDPKSLVKLASDYKKVAAAAFLLAENGQNESIMQAWHYLNQVKTFQLKIQLLKSQKTAQLIDSEDFWEQKLFLEDQISALKAERATALFQADKPKADSLHSKLQDNRIALLMLHHQFADDIQSSSQKLFVTLPVGQIQQLLTDKTCLIETLITDSAYYLLCLQNNAVKLHYSHDLPALSKAWKSYYRDLKTGNDVNHSANVLAEKLLFPFSAEINDSDHLVFLPDDFLYKTPIALLPYSTSGDYLLSHLSVSYHYSAYLYYQSAVHKTEPHKHLLALAPSFDFLATAKNSDLRKLSTLSKNPSALPHSRDEVVSIAKLFEKTNNPYKVFINDNATKEAFIKNVEEADILHIATHSYTLDEHSGLQGLILSPESNSITNGLQSSFLHEAELANISTKADLVVLSACSSGIGALAEGEGIMALPRAFFQAGASRVIASLWPVNDLATAKLMKSFYKRLLRGESAAEALQGAQLDCAAEGMPVIDWAAFILLGP